MSDSFDQRSLTRREEYSEATRLAVVDAARELFGRNGHARTKVDEIAQRARVSPSTVYSKCGGKQGLLETLMNSWTLGPAVEQIIDDCRKVKTGHDMLSVLADGYLTMYNESGDIIRIVTEAAASSLEAERLLQTANLRHLNALGRIVAGIRATGELAADLSDDDVVKAIYFHFRYQQFALTIEEFGWNEVRSRDVIRTWVERAILKV